MSYVVKILMLFIFVFNITSDLTDNGSQYLRQLLENYQQVNYTYIGDILISEEDNHLHPNQIVTVNIFLACNKIKKLHIPNWLYETIFY